MTVTNGKHDAPSHQTFSPIAPAPSKPRVGRTARYLAQVGIMEAIEREREHQDRKWGLQEHHPLEWQSILAEEFGEVSKATNEAYFGNGDFADYRAGLIQTAAVCVAMLVDLDTRGADKLALVTENGGS